MITYKIRSKLLFSRELHWAKYWDQQLEPHIQETGGGGHIFYRER